MDKCNNQLSLPVSYAIPESNLNVNLYTPVRGMLTPYEYSGWRAETNSWKLTAYLGTSLTAAPTYRIFGPDAQRFLERYCVNGFKNFPPDSGRHGVMCRENGDIMIDGVLLRTGENEFLTYWMFPYIAYCLEKAVNTDKLDVKGEDLTGTVYLYQLGGPRSLEILEAASGQNLHELKFMHHCKVTIAGHEATVLRLGMAGALSYEIHGPRENCMDIYQAIWEAGQGYGLLKLGHRAYLMNHTENGFPQSFYHFIYPWEEETDFTLWLKSKGIKHENERRYLGSVGSEIKLRYKNPIELGWHNAVKFNHDFVGRAALEKIAEDDDTRIVTLKWDVDDILDVHRSQFEQGEHYKPMDYPNDRLYLGSDTLNNDLVLNLDGERIGVSSGRCYSYYYRDMISLCTISKKFSQIGTEVRICWGDAGGRIKKIKATVERFPYYDKERNETFDTTNIPLHG